MDDVALYTVYYSHYHARAAEAATAPSIQRKGQGLICAFLAFGAACGISTVAVGFFAHNPAIIWPVVTIGLAGVAVGLLLAHRKATGGWMWRSTPTSDVQQHYSGTWGTSGENAVLGGGDRGAGGRFQLPMYCADALDVEMGIVVQSPYSPGSSSCEWGGKGTAADSEGEGSDVQAASKRVGPAVAMEPMTAAAAAAAAAEYGTVMCGVPLAGADGWIDTRPVLVLQPHPQMLLQLQSQHPPSSDDSEVQEGRAAASEVVDTALSPPPLRAVDGLRGHASASGAASDVPACRTAMLTHGAPAPVAAQPPSAAQPPTPQPQECALQQELGDSHLSA